MPDLKFLVAKLNPACRLAAERAASLAVSQGHPEVETLHLLSGMLQTSCADLRSTGELLQLDLTALSIDVRNALQGKFVNASVRTPSLSDDLIHVLQAAWARSVELNSPAIRSGVILLALAESDSSLQSLKGVSLEFSKLDGRIIRGNLRTVFTPDEGIWGENKGNLTEPESGAALGQYTLDLTAAARAGALDPVIGREAEIRQLIDILSRRRQNNAILTGDPGVGKTAVVEGFALRLAMEDVPPILRGMSVRTLDLGLLIAGASVRGEMEGRLKTLMREVQSSAEPIILFVDEAHMLVGGQNETANLLKPALARGELRMIAATTYVEYRKYFEGDPALARRFQMVNVQEPSEERAIQMLRGLVPRLEKHHGVRIQGDAVRASVQLSHRYVTGRQLPDKAIGILDTACARTAAAQNATPALIDDCRNQIAVLEDEIREMERERSTGAGVQPELDALFEQLGVLEMQLANLEDRCSEERSLAGRAVSLRAKLEGGTEHETGQAELAEITSALLALQGDSPLIPAFVDARVIGEVVSELTGIPVRRMLDSELNTVLGLRMQLEERVVGQTHAIELISKRILSSRAGMDDPRRPMGVFLLAGPSGVGKTETALALADILFGGEQNAVVLNMTEFQEPHSISVLKGSPPGYVGYGEGGVLSEAVRRRPYCLILLDEMEKAHTDVMELFYQVFDKGTLEDAQGRSIDFRNTLILVTSNAGAEFLTALHARPGSLDPENAAQVVLPELKRVFQPALLGRMTVVPYLPLTPDSRRRIAEIKLAGIRKRLQDTHHVELIYSPELVDYAALATNDNDTGARSIEQYLSNHLIPDLSYKVLYAGASRKSIATIHVDVTPTGDLKYKLG